MISSNPKKADLGMDEDIDWDRILEDVPATPGWLRVDEREDAIGAIEHAADTVVTVTGKPLNWKWVIIATHNALQGALVCTLSGTAGDGYALWKRRYRRPLASPGATVKGRSGGLFLADRRLYGAAWGPASITPGTRAHLIRPCPGPMSVLAGKFPHVAPLISPARGSAPRGCRITWHG